MKIKRALNLILPFIALVLQILPFSAVLNFGNPDGEPYRTEYSCFDLILVGYGNFGPFVAAWLTCAVIVLLVIYCITGRRGVAAAAKIILLISALLTLTPLLFGINYITAAGLAVTSALAAEFVMISLSLRNK